MNAARTVLVHSEIGSAHDLALLVRTRMLGMSASAQAASSTGSVASGGAAADDGAGRSAATTVDITVRYDGEDLQAVAVAVGMRPEEVIALHSAASYTLWSSGLPARRHCCTRQSMM